MQEQHSEEQEVIPSDMLAVSYNNEWSSKVEKVPLYHTALDILIWTLPSFILETNKNLRSQIQYPKNKRFFNCPLAGSSIC